MQIPADLAPEFLAFLKVAYSAEVTLRDEEQFKKTSEYGRAVIAHLNAFVFVRAREDAVVAHVSVMGGPQKFGEEVEAAWVNYSNESEEDHASAVKET